MKKNKRKNETVVINKDPLATTTIGKLDTKENGPIFAIVGIAIFVVCIFCLPYLSEWIANFSFTPPTIVQNPNTPETPTDDGSDEDNETTYYNLTDDLRITLDTVTFQNFVVDETNRAISLDAVISGGSSNNLFQNINYYLEIYTNDELLLDRMRLIPTTTGTVFHFALSLRSNVTPSDISKVAIVIKEEEDYPAVELNEVDGVPTFVCTKDNETVTYRFALEEEVYVLKEIEEEALYETDATDYETKLAEYNELYDSYSNIDGVTTHLNPLSNGFSFNTTIDLEEVGSAVYQRTFTKDIYYPLNTDVRIVAFELSASLYTCE